MQDENTPAGKVADVRPFQLQGLEACVISQTDQEGKERLRGRFVLCHTPLFKALLLFFPQGGTTEEAHGLPVESEVLHGNH
ncbi:hypothetical protein A6P54_00725 [Bacillus sp. MKU004]|nr:hypothetical protein A6P54_00725 [Bacillus sp. MKU004]